MNKPITSFTEIETIEIDTALTLDELVRARAQRMLKVALEAEVEAYMEQHTLQRDENDHALVVRIGKAWERTLQTGAGSLPIAAPRVYDQRPATASPAYAFNISTRH